MNRFVPCEVSDLTKRTQREQKIKINAIPAYGMDGKNKEI